MDAEGETGRSKGGVIGDVIVFRKTFLRKHVLCYALVFIFLVIGSIVFCHMEGNVVQPNRRKRKRAAQRISRSSGGGDEVDEAEVRI